MFFINDESIFYRAEPEFQSRMAGCTLNERIPTPPRSARFAEFGFDRSTRCSYVAHVQKEHASTGAFDSPELRFLMRMPLPRTLMNYLGRELLRFVLTLQGLGAFALITLGVIVTKLGKARHVVWPKISQETARAGLRLAPMFLYVSAAVGLVVIGQTVSWLTRVGAINYLGAVMVIVVVRELGPLLTALLVLARVGTANVIELGTARAMGEVEALEAVGIDPVHYLVVPRVLGMALGVFSLTVYLILGALLSGYLWAFLQDVPLRPGDYFRQLAGALSGLDFALLGLKTLAFGFIIATVTCYHGLAQPLRIEEVSLATVRAVAQGILGCLVVDALFIVIYLSV
jgi:phospholipid/cholesterol/gamma-HCH transport system permease protein